MPDSCARRKTGTATNSRLWNWLAVPGLPTPDTPPVGRPIFIPPDEVLPHNGTDTNFRRRLPEIGCLSQGLPHGTRYSQRHPMRILMVAADRMEFSGILAHSAGVSPAHLAVDWSRSVRLGSHQLVLAANGAGAQRAASAVEAALRGFPAEAIVSIGFCGALAEELQIADIVVGSAISVGSRTFPALYPACARRHQTGVVCSIDHVARTAAEKRRLRSGGGSVVEMEAAGVADRAAARGLPFYCVRVVTDLAGEDMANDFNRALRPDGHFATMSILRDTLRNPLVRLPELLRLRHRCVWAARVLGDFIADCRF
jgi:adenosylhomocysteine nucleosidase